MLELNIDLKTEDDKNIYLRIPRNASFSLLNTIYKNYNWDKDGASIDVNTIVENDDKHIALNLAFREIQKSNTILSFLYDVNIKNTNWNNSINQVELFSSPLCFKNSKNLLRILTVNKVLNAILENDFNYFNYIIRTIEYYVRALEFLDSDLTEESLLNSFKCIELLSNLYCEREIKHKMHEEIKNTYLNFFKCAFNEEIDTNQDSAHYKRYTELLRETLFGNSSRKIDLLLKSLDISITKKQINKFVTIRSRDVAHGNITSSNVSLEDAMKVNNLSKEVISKYFLDNNYKNAYLKSTLSLY